MRKVPALALVFALTLVGLAPASAAPKATIVTAAFKNLLNVTGSSLDSLEQKYEADIDTIEATLAAAISAADEAFVQELKSSTDRYDLQLKVSDESIAKTKIVFLANNSLTIQQVNLFNNEQDQLWQNLICPETTLPNGAQGMEFAKRNCVNDNNLPRPGDISNKTTSKNLIVGEDWQPGDVAQISWENSLQPFIYAAINIGWIVPVNPSLFDSSRMILKGEADKARLRQFEYEKALASAPKQRDLRVSWATKAREDALTGTREAYETAKAKLEAEEKAARIALLAAKRASKDSKNFDSAFAIAYKFEYNRQKVGEIEDAAWTGEWTFRTIDTIIEVNKLAAAGDSIGRQYSKSKAAAFNSAVGNAFTNEPDFRAALKVLTTIYKKTTKVTLKF